MGRTREEDASHLRSPMTAMQDLPTGWQAGQFPRRVGAARIKVRAVRQQLEDALECEIGFPGGGAGARHHLLLLPGASREQSGEYRSSDWMAWRRFRAGVCAIF